MGMTANLIAAKNIQNIPVFSKETPMVSTTSIR